MLCAAACRKLVAMGLHVCAQKEKHIITLLTLRSFDFFFFKLPTEVPRRAVAGKGRGEEENEKMWVKAHKFTVGKH